MMQQRTSRGMFGNEAGEAEPAGTWKKALLRPSASPPTWCGEHCLSPAPRPFLAYPTPPPPPGLSVPLPLPRARGGEGRRSPSVGAGYKMRELELTAISINTINYVK